MRLGVVEPCVIDQRPISARTSLRRVASSRKQPSIRLVTIATPGVRTPRPVMQPCCRLDHDGHAPRAEPLPDAIGDLRGQPFLHLQALRKAVRAPRELRDADDMAARKIGDRRGSRDRSEMMLAVRLKRDIAQQHDLVIAADLFESPREVMAWIFLVADTIFQPSAGGARGRLDQSLAIRIVADPFDERPESLLDLERNRRLPKALPLGSPEPYNSSRWRLSAESDQPLATIRPSRATSSTAIPGRGRAASSCGFAVRRAGKAAGRRLCGFARRHGETPSARARARPLPRRQRRQ